MGTMPTNAKAVRAVKAAILRGRTWREAVEGTGFSRTTARRRLWRFYPSVFADRRRRVAAAPVSSAERRKIARRLALAESYRAIAKAVGRSPDTVWRIARKVSEDVGGELAPRRVRKPVVCPVCETRIMLVPCVVCAARGASKRGP